MGGSSCKESISGSCKMDGWLGARRKNVGRVEYGPTLSENLIVLAPVRIEGVYMAIISCPKRGSK